MTMAVLSLWDGKSYPLLPDGCPVIGDKLIEYGFSEENGVKIYGANMMRLPEPIYRKVLLVNTSILGIDLMRATAPHL